MLPTDKNLHQGQDSKILKKPEIHAGGLNFSKDNSLFHGKATVSKNSIRRDLRSPVFLRQLKGDLSLTDSKDVKEVAEDIESMVNKVQMFHINKPVAKKIIDQDRNEKEKNAVEKMKGGLSPQESKEIKQGRKFTEFLKKKFGFK